MKPPTLSRPAGKLFLLFLIHFGRHLTITHLFGFGVDHAAAFTPQGSNAKVSHSLSAQRSWFKANNGINGRGPPEAGRMPFMPAVRLNQREWSATERDPLFYVEVFLPVRFPPFSVFTLFAVQSFGPLNVCCPNASDLVGARFKLLSAGAGSKHGDLCNEQIRDSNERSHLSCGFVQPKRH
jgi:hypothetical protein